MRRDHLCRIVASAIGFTLTAGAAAQSPAQSEWTWVSGSDAINQPGIYGTQGTAAPANVPPGRNYASGWVDNSGNFWIFAGAFGNDFGGPNDLWEFNPATAEWTWVAGSSSGTQPGIYGVLGMPASGNVPGSRVSASNWTDSSGNFWLFGGYGDGSGSIGCLSDLWEFNPSTKQWAWMGGNGTAGLAGVYGTLGVAAAGNIPGGRYLGQSWNDGKGHFWLFGGAVGGGCGSYSGPNDLWKFDPSNNEWTWVGGSQSFNQPGVYGTMGTPAATNVPGSRILGTTWTDSNGNLWLFGGETAEGILNDLWEYSPSANDWTWIGGSSTADQAGVYGTLGTFAPGNIPGNRADAASWTDSSGNLWLFGGADDNGDELDDLWEFDPATSEWAWMGGTGAVGPYGGQPGVYGVLGTPAAGNIPGGRFASANWSDSSGNFWLFGGGGLGASAPAGYGFLNDLWEYIPQPPATVVTWSAPSAITYGTALSATQLDAKANVAGTFTYSPALGTVLDAGTQTLSVTFIPENTNQYSAATVSVQLVVNKATLTVAPAPPPSGAAEFTLGYGDRFPLATDLCQISGFVNGDTLAVVSGSPSPTVSWGSNPEPPVGNYTLTCALGTLSAVNYTFALNSAPETIAVTPDPLIIKPISLTKVYGKALPKLIYNATGLAYGQTLASVLIGAPTITTTANATSGVGEYPITLSLAGVSAGPNYTLTTPPTATLTITPALLNARAENAKSKYGEPLPSLDFRLTGFVNGDTSAVVSGMATLTTTATSGSPVGSYPITFGSEGLSAENYTIDYLGATLNVGPGTLVARAINVDVVAGKPIPPLTYRITGFVNGDSDSVVSGSAALTTSATQDSPAGTYPITFSTEGLSAANYNVVYANATLTIREP